MKLIAEKRKPVPVLQDGDAPVRRTRAPAASGSRRAGRIALIATLAVVAALAAGSAAGIHYVNKMDRIFPNVTLDGMDIGGLTVSETAQKLRESGYGDFEGKEVSVLLPTDYRLTVSADEVCSETPVTELAMLAWDACKGGGALGNTATYLRCRFGGMALESNNALSVDADAVRAAVDNAAAEVRRSLLSSELSVGEDSIRLVKGAQGVALDTDAITGMIVDAMQTHNYSTLHYQAEIQTSEELDLQSVYDSIHTESADAYYDRDQDAIVPERLGLSFDMPEAQRLWNAAAYGEEVVIPLRTEEPAVTAAALEALLFRDCLSSKTTSLAGSSGNRVNNVRKAAESINGVILLPGEEFSYNPTLGERTKENGYMLAGAYSGGQTVQEYGGGICQVSSTLYYCTLYANLQITARTCHMFPVGYLPPGLDATVSWGGPEFKFVNDREYPVRISAAVDENGRNVTVELWGTDVDGNYVEVTSETWYMYDPTYTSVRTGYKAQTYRSIYDKDGNLLSKKPEATSTYNYHKEDIAYPVQAEETPVQPETGDFPTDVALPEILNPGAGGEGTVPVSGGGEIILPGAGLSSGEAPAAAEEPPAPAPAPALPDAGLPVPDAEPVPAQEPVADPVPEPAPAPVSEPIYDPLPPIEAQPDSGWQMQDPVQDLTPAQQNVPAAVPDGTLLPGLFDGGF